MTDVLDRLTDAMSAAAGTVREQDLRPLTAPERPRRRRHRPAWAVPVAAAAAVVLVIGLAVAMSHQLSGTSRHGGPGLRTRTGSMIRSPAGSARRSRKRATTRPAAKKSSISA